MEKLERYDEHVGGDEGLMVQGLQGYRGVFDDSHNMIVQILERISWVGRLYSN